MTIWAIGSLHGAPGASALAIGLGLAWPIIPGRYRLLLEADPDGGVLAPRFDELRADRTVADVAVAMRRDPDAARIVDVGRKIWGVLPAIPAHPSAEQTSSILQSSAERIGAGLAALADLDAIVDVGRLTVRSPALALARQAAVTILVSRPRFEDVALLAIRVRELRSSGIEPLLVSVGSRPYDPYDVAHEAGLSLLATIPDDPAAAAVLTGERGADGRLRRSLLWRTVGGLASQLLELAPQIPPVDANQAAARPAESRNVSSEVPVR